MSITAMMQGVEKGTLSPSRSTSSGMIGTGSAGCVMQCYVNTVLAQPDLTLDFLPELPTHQKMARDNAVEWRDKLQPKLYSTISDIIDFGNQYTSFYDPLVQLAQQIKDNPSNQDAIKGLKQGLSILKTNVEDKEKKANLIVVDLSSFHQDLSSIARDVNGDYVKVSAKLAGEDGEIKALQDRIDSINSAMSKDLAMIAGGSAAAVVGGLIIAVGVLAEIPTAGASTALVVGGVAVVGAGAGVAIAGGVDYGKKTKELKLAMESLSRAKSQFSAATNVNHYIQELSARTQEAMSAISSLQKGWQTLGNDFDITLEAFDRVDPDFAFFLCAQLEAANKNWKATLDQAKYINEQTNLPTKQGLINEDGKVDAHAQLVA